MGGRVPPLGEAALIMTADTHDRLHRVVRFAAVTVSSSAVAGLPIVGPAVWAVLDSRSRTQEL